MKIAIPGLSITSSWGDGHATTHRSLVQGLKGRGHDMLFLERDAAWYGDNRDEPNPPGAETFVYGSVYELVERFEPRIAAADLVIVGAFAPVSVILAPTAKTGSPGSAGRIARERTLDCRISDDRAAEFEAALESVYARAESAEAVCGA